MERPLPLLRMHWDQEPERSNVGQASRLPSERESASRNVVGFADGARWDARPTLWIHGKLYFPNSSTLHGASRFGFAERTFFTSSAETSPAFSPYTLRT